VISVSQKVSVRFEYTVHFTESAHDLTDGAFPEILGADRSARPPRVLIAIDQGVVDAWPSCARELSGHLESCGRGVEIVCPPLVIPGGEAAKNDERFYRDILKHIHDLGLDRHSYVLAIGGGAVLDVVGLAAALAHRGVRLIRMPTTVLGQADSGIGVKNGINLFGKKNFLGTFTPPYAVINEARFLRTLSRRDCIAGMAEAVKVALVRDPAFFEWMRMHAELLHAGDMTKITELVRRSALLHLRHIATSGDPFELGSARPLDFGHWAAHKMESLSDYRLRHGEAVAIGIALDTLVSSDIGLCGPEVPDVVIDLLMTLGFKLWDETLEMVGAGRRLAVLDGLNEFREHLGGELTVTMLRRPGEGVEIHEMDEGRVLYCLNRLRERASVGEPRGDEHAPDVLHEHPPRRELDRGTGQPGALSARRESASPPAW
jgi:3-dehydroquinate synthase